MKNLIARTQFATQEAKELRRIRSSLSFRLAVLLTSLLRNPLKLLGLPFLALREIIFHKPELLSQNELNPKSIVLIGIDTRGTMWSERAMKLAIELQRFDSDLRISLLTTSDTLLKDRVGKLLHYRIPRPRSLDSSRRDWNLTCERLLSTVIYSQESSRIVFLGNYLYSGLCHSLNSSPSGIHLHWMNSGNNLIGLDKLIIDNSTSVFEDSLSSSSSHSTLSESTMQDHLNLRLDQTTLVHLQLSSSSLKLWEKPLETSLANLEIGHSIVTASNKKYAFLSETIDIPRNIEPFSTPGFHFRITDDQPDHIERVNHDRIPSIILRTGRELDQVSLKILEELERFGAAIVLRKPNLFTVIDALNALVDTNSRTAMVANRAKTSSDISQEISWAASMHSRITSD